MSTTARTLWRRASLNSSPLTRSMQRFLARASITMFALVVLSLFMMPFAYMFTTALKGRVQLSDPNAPLYPARQAAFRYQGQEALIYKVPVQGVEKQWALVQKGREESLFIDPANPEASPIRWQGRWRTLEQVWIPDSHWENFTNAWKLINFPRLLRNTLVIAILGSIGTLLSSIAVGYGFARFDFPGKNVLFMILIATIILPRTVTLVPTYALFSKIGWVGTWLPLIVPHFFANAYNVFLLRQFFLAIPREMDEAAMLDGANPLQTLIWIILPQALPAVVAVGLFHFFFAWNDFFEPLIYLSSRPDLQPMSIGLYTFSYTYYGDPHMIQATALMGLVLPVILFFMAQRVFIQGVVITGVEK